MHSSIKVFSNVASFYEDLFSSVLSAKSSISMMYWAYEYGAFSKGLNELLKHKSQAGVDIRIIVDEIGMVLDGRQNYWKSLKSLLGLRRHGVEVSLFNPGNNRLAIKHRLHTKLCSIDSKVLFIGGSNIGDRYVNSQDTNISIRGAIGKTDKDILDIVANYSSASTQNRSGSIQLDCFEFELGSVKLLFSVPNSILGLRNHFSQLLNSSVKEIYIQHWCFRPDEKLTNVLLEKLGQGVKVNILVSKNTRYPTSNYMNLLSTKKLISSGASFFEYSRRHMHSKVIWNNLGDVLIGSANFESWGLSRNIELCASFNDKSVTETLSLNFRELSDVSVRHQPSADVHEGYQSTIH